MRNADDLHMIRTVSTDQLAELNDSARRDLTDPDLSLRERQKVEVFKDAVLNEMCDRANNC